MSLNDLSWREMNRRVKGKAALDDSDLLAALEEDQLVEAKLAHLDRTPLRPWMRVLLWSMRVYVLILFPLVCYLFVVSLGK